ncbi:hypothetical protein WJ977_09665 [Achromobacter xylosoxidans]
MLDGRLAPGQRLPSGRDLAAHWCRARHHPRGIRSANSREPGIRRRTRWNARKRSAAYHRSGRRLANRQTFGGFQPSIFERPTAVPNGRTRSRRVSGQALGPHASACPTRRRDH